MVSKVSVISQAYTYLGQQGISDIATGNAREGYVSAIYDNIYPTLLSSRPWSFALTTQILAQLSSPLDLDDWSYGYQLPTDPKWLKIYRTRPNVDFHIYGNELYTNSSTMQIDYIQQVAENNLPDYFVTLLIYTLTSNISMLITQQVPIMEVWEKKARQAFRVASGVDSQNQPNRAFSDQPLLNAHYSSNSSRNWY